MKVGNVSTEFARLMNYANPAARESRTAAAASPMPQGAGSTTDAAWHDLAVKLSNANFHDIAARDLVSLANALHEKGVISDEVNANIGLYFAPLHKIHGDPSVDLNAAVSQNPRGIDAIQYFQDKVDQYNRGNPNVSNVSAQVRATDNETLHVLQQLQAWIESTKHGGPIDEVA